MFSSKDFTKTPSHIQTSIPEKLIHKNVQGAERDAGFSTARKHSVHLVDLPTHTISMTLGGLEPTQTTNRHRHSYESVIYIIEGRGMTIVEDREVFWEKGDAIYIPVWAWHHHENLSASETCTYVACENAPLLQNLGGIALREEPL